MKGGNLAAGGLAGIHQQRVARDITRLVAGQIEQGIGRILGGGGYAQRRAGGNGLGGLIMIGAVAGDDKGGHGGDGVAWGDGVDPHSVLRQL